MYALIEPGLIPIAEAEARMEAHVERIRAHGAPELVWLVEHPSVYSLGTSAQTDEIRVQGLPLRTVRRGGRVTYHGPGQRVVYVMVDVRARGGDVRAFVQALTQWFVRVLAGFGVRTVEVNEHIGVWVIDPAGEERKIAAIGVRIRKGVSYHGVALNVSTDLSRFDAIIPCGIGDKGVTSLHALGHRLGFAEVDRAVLAAVPSIFGDVKRVDSWQELPDTFGFPGECPG